MLTLATTHVTREYLIDLFYKIECQLQLARKYRNVSYCPSTLRESQRAVMDALQERRWAIDLALDHRYCVQDLWHAVDLMMFEGSEE